MEDLFDNNEFDGESVFAPSVEPSQEVNADTTALDGLETSSDVSDNGQEAPTEEATDQVPVEKAPTEEELEALLADERTPKFYKNYVNNLYKPNLAKANESLEQYATYGTAEEVAQKMSLVNSLSEVRTDPNTGMPTRTTENFVKDLYENDREAVLTLMNDLAQMPSPNTEGITVIQEVFKSLGIDPSRLSDVQRFAENGYTMQASEFPQPDADELELIPKHLQATFAKLDPERRYALMIESDTLRDSMLEDFKVAYETRESQAGRQQQELEQQQQTEQQQQLQFKQTVDAKGEDYANRASEFVLNSFVDSLAKTAGMSKLDSQMIANTVLNSFEPGLAGQMSKDALKSEGIEVDPIIQQTIAQLQEAARHAGYYEVTGDKVMLDKTVARQVELQEKLTAKGNKIIAVLAMKRSSNNPAIQTSANLAATQNTRHAIAGMPSSGIATNSAPVTDFSDESYLDDLRASGFGSR